MLQVKNMALKAIQKYVKYDLKRSLLPDFKENTWFQECTLTDSYNTECPTKDITNLKSSVVSIYNPGPQREVLIKIPVKDDFIQLIDSMTNTAVEHDI